MFQVGQRVGIVAGVQSVNGPHIVATGRVVRRVELWRGSPEYIVHLDDAVSGDEDLLYAPFLLRGLS